MTEAVERLAADDRTVAISNLGNRDEIGQIARAVEVFKENALRVGRLQAEQATTNVQDRLGCR